ncbi:MAG: hypothetical protein KVP17_003132 [Porospora cf. gigantea B]|nr:MAG: hypothetical protein KVP17_003132 [Porospora cf. gigantea B]
MTLVGAVPDEDEGCEERNRILELIWADDEVDESEPLPPSDSGGPDDSATAPPDEVSSPLGRALELKRMVPTLAEIVVAQKDDPSAYGSAYARRDGIVLFHGRIYIPPGHWR